LLSRKGGLSTSVAEPYSVPGLLDMADFFEVLMGAAAGTAILHLSNRVSYGYLKSRILKERIWDLNICCGKTDGGGVNADILQHAELPNFVKVDDIYDLPFEDKQFNTVLCSHTMEHVDNPTLFCKELQRVGKEVTIVVPPLWDIGAVINVLEHKWIFLTFKKRHRGLPPHVPLPFARAIHRRFGQRIHA
jgi:SAM-dependent methyltransferase